MAEVEMTAPQKKNLDWIYDVLFILVLLVGAFFRFRGSNWGELNAQHPDENFITGVIASIQPVKTLSEYFNTATSTLNPANVGQGAYVYGTLPLFGVRFLGNALKITDFRLFGRQMAALTDLCSVFVLYFLVKRLYKRRVAWLAAAFSALAVEQIQASHFFTTDSFVTFFIVLTLYFAVLIATGKWETGSGADVPSPAEKVTTEQKTSRALSNFIRNPLTWQTLAFGLALGMAAASKINAVVLAALLPVALFVRYFYVGRRDEFVDESGGIKPKDAWERFEGFIAKTIVFMVLGAIVSFFVFRILQPYAFSGPGLFGIKPNAAWVQTLKGQLAQASPNSDLPWDLQWARRTHLYFWQNLTRWGLGLPLGLLASFGFLWMAWRMLRGEWRQHLVLWLMTAGFFVWVSLQYNPTMRYGLPIYPTLAMMAAWVVIWFWDWGRQAVGRKGWMKLVRPAAAIVGGLVLLLTLGWAYAFSNIYVHTEPRITASNWVFQNVPGPLNLQVKTPAGMTVQQPVPLAVPFNEQQTDVALQAGTPFETTFTARQDGLVDKLLIPHVTDQALRITITQDPNQPPLASGTLLSIPAGVEAAASQQLVLNQQPNLTAQQNYFIIVQAVNPALQVDLCGPIQFTILGSTSPSTESLDPGPNCTLGPGQTLQIPFVLQENGYLANLLFTRLANLASAGPQTLHVTLIAADQSVSTGSASANLTPVSDPRGEPITLTLDKPFQIKKGEAYSLHLDTTSAGLTILAATVANETDFDYPLPFRVDGYDPFPGYYRGDLNLQVYWEDNPNKLQRFENTLNQSDYILIPTNHQYAQITRLPERYPLTTQYYRDLIGCPQNKTIIWCYENGEPGMFHGTLGYDLVATFEDYPAIGPVRINDETAEEAFTFYDHPKVLVFKKSAAYDPASLSSVLGAVDTSTAIHLTPGQADHFKSTLLPAPELAAQQAGGTWSALFNTDAFYNSFPGLGVVLWYILILLLGLVTYPIVRAALPGLNDHGYPLARVVGLLLWAWFAWMAGSIGLTYSRTAIALCLLLLIAIGLWLAWRQRDEIAREIREHWKYFLLVEGLFLAFFMVDLLIRLGNPDLWHPAKGGERPMEFAYFNAILKSTSFPPYDPWFAGGYINYYYWGYVIVGTPVKLLGIVPSIAFNFLLPTLFACVAMTAFSVGWNLLAAIRDRKVDRSEAAPSAEPGEESAPDKGKSSLWDARFFGGISAASAIILLGNLGIVRMLYQGFERVAAPGGVIDKAGLFTRIGWTVKGFFMTLAGAHLPYGPGDWYWIPSRALPGSSGDPITEFPIFSFIYSDMHAHVIALMITILAIAWALSVLLSKAKWKNPLNAVIGFFLGALVVGVIKPTNTWDYYTYVILVSVVLAYSVWRYADVSRLRIDLPEWIKRLALTVGAVVILVGGSMLLFQPYTKWYLLDPGYTKIYPWTDGRSDIGSYLVHWGVFLFFIVSWLVWETRQWLAGTPASSLRKLRPYRDLIILATAVFLFVLLLQQWWATRTIPNGPQPWKGVTIVWVALPLAVWVGVLLLFHPRLSDAKRLMLFMVGTGLLLTIVVEFFVMGGDIGRMNMVFKIYYQAWTLLGLSAAAAFIWLLGELNKWLSGWRIPWEIASTALIAGAALFILMGSLGKIDDRMATTTPHSLDSMTYMNYSTYFERNSNLDLSYDYKAIKWMQENVKGSPVIAEAPSSGIQYEWFNRFSIYTGLPDVIGWEWHQMQQRVIFSNIVRSRANEENNFYTTPDIDAALAFIHKYNVKYIIVGELEHAVYVVGTGFAPEPNGCPDCLAKFPQYDGKYWHTVYHDGPMTIYEVNP